ncbi:hypothetical protein INR49_004949 [Caranx melampygus]|nr:hypothetical protein INR49_004949 [Caranx melampygus]
MEIMTITTKFRCSSTPRGARCTAAVEVAAELGEVDGGCPGRGTVEAEVSGGDRFPGLLHARERGEDMLLGSGGERWG